jgi:general secretion pathway protein J
MSCKARGFTLIEVVVSITILSLIVLATVTAMRTLATTQERLEQKSIQTSQMQVVTNYLRQALIEAKPIAVYDFGTLVDEYFHGNKEYLQLVAPLAVNARTGGLWSLRLSVTERQLIAQYQPGLQPPEWPEDALTYVLLSDVDEFSVAYRESGYAEWVSKWGAHNEVSTPAMPSHVRFRFKVAGRYWPDIIVATSTNI